MQETGEILVLSLGGEDSPGEGNCNRLQYSCWNNPMDRGSWWATVHAAAKSWTRLSTAQHSTQQLLSLSGSGCHLSSVCRCAQAVAVDTCDVDTTSCVSFPEPQLFMHVFLLHLRNHIGRIGELRFITLGPEELTLQALSPEQMGYRVFIHRQA